MTSALHFQGGRFKNALFEYFRHHWDGRDIPVIDHALRVEKLADGSFHFYIHPANTSGITTDFSVTSDATVERDNFAGIGWAIKQMHNGSKVARAGWNGKGMFLYYVPAKVQWGAELGMENIQYAPYIAMKTVQGTVVPWLASQTDLLATDWTVVS